MGTVRVGVLDFGHRARTNLDGIQLGWYDRWLRGDEPAFLQHRRVRLFVMGDNVWCDEEDWSLARADERAMYLHSGGGEHGHWRWDAPVGDAGDAAPDRYRIDPGDPVPTLGRGAPGVRAVPQGSTDSAPSSSVFDVLAYTSPPLEHDVEVAGWVRAQGGWPAMPDQRTWWSGWSASGGCPGP